MVSISWPRDPPVSASQSAGITGLSHRARPTGQFSKERDLMELQFHMAGETSQSWQKARRSKSHLTWVAAGKERASLCKETPIFKTARSCETYSLLQEQHGEDLPPWFNYLPTGPSHNTWELWEPQFKMRFGWGHSQTISISYWWTLKRFWVFLLVLAGFKLLNYLSLFLYFGIYYQISL